MTGPSHSLQQLKHAGIAVDACNSAVDCDELRKLT